MEPKSEENTYRISRRHTLLRSLILSSAIAFGLAACGGGGSGSSPAISPPPSPPPPPPPPPPPAGTVIFTGDDGVSGIRLYAVEDDATGHRALSDTLSSQQRGLVPFEISPDEDWVAFIGNPEGANQLYVNEVSGGTPLRINRVEQSGGVTTTVKSFDWSPDSQQLVFAADLDNRTPRGQNTTGFANEAYIVDRDGSNEAKINGGIGARASVDIRNPQWSPTGPYILQEVGSIGVDVGLANAVNLHDTSGTLRNSRRVATMFSFLIDVTWAPDGDRFAFLGDFDALGESEIWMGNTALDGRFGDGADDISDSPSFENVFAFSPADSRILFTERFPSSDPNGDWRFIFGQQGTTYDADHRIGPQLTSSAQPRFNSSGNFFGYILDRDFYVSVTGSERRAPIVPRNGNQFVTHFEWSPDGTRLAFTANLDLESQVELYVINRDGSGLISVSDGVGNEQVSINFEWSPDSTQIAFSAGISALTPSTVYIADADGSGITRISDPLITDIGQVAYVSN